MILRKLELLPQNWYGWQMLPGYLGTPYFSPIWIEGVTPRKTGKGILGVTFINVFYAAGVQDCDINLRIMKHEEDYLVSEILYGSNEPNDRTAIVSRIDFDWIRLFCPTFWQDTSYLRSMANDGLAGLPHQTASEYLSRAFGLSS